MSKFISYFLTLIFLSVLVSCKSVEVLDVASEPEDEGTSVTLWTEKTELFLEYPTLIVGEEAAFAAHLSDIKNFKPVTQGKLTSTFTSEDGVVISNVAETPSYPGIFRPVITFSKAGIYEMELRLEGPQVEDTIVVKDVLVYANKSDAPLPGSPPDEVLITFLKEQQWNIDFKTEPVRKNELMESIRAVGEIMPDYQMHAEVPAPINGFILSYQNTNIPSQGSWVSKGDVLAVISPPATIENSLLAIRTEYLLSEAEYERTERLFEKQAVPAKRFNEAKLLFEARKANFDALTKQIDFNINGNDGDNVSIHYYLTAPIDGFVEELHFHIGQNVKTGENLFTLTNLKTVLLKANVPVSHISGLQSTHNASFKVEGYEEEFEVAKLNGKLVSIGNIVNEKSRTVPVIYELKNPGNKLKIGMFAEVSVKIGESSEMLSIPNSAILDDDGTPVVYVHISGEAFAKRILKTGISDRGYTQVLEGLVEGERVVTIGAYQVRLASLSTSVPVGHGHEH